jgi:hypothetical protein
MQSITVEIYGSANRADRFIFDVMISNSHAGEGTKRTG